MSRTELKAEFARFGVTRNFFEHARPLPRLISFKATQILPTGRKVAKHVLKMISRH